MVNVQGVMRICSNNNRLSRQDASPTQFFWGASLKTYAEYQEQWEWFTATIYMRCFYISVNAGEKPYRL